MDMKTGISSTLVHAPESTWAFDFRQLNFFISGGKMFA